MLEILKKHHITLLMAALMYFVGGIGQTYLLSLFNPYLIQDLSISGTFLGALYSGATLLASFALPWLGRMIDRKRFRFNLLMIGSLLSGGLFSMYFVTGPTLLFLAFFLMRFSGQTGINMLATTYLSKIFGAHRGKSFAISQLGRPVADSIFPLFITFMAMHYSWRAGFLGLGLTVFCLFIPAIYFLSTRADTEKELLYEENEEVLKLRDDHDLSYAVIMKNYKTYFILLSNLMLPFFMTGMFFTHAQILAQKQIPLELWAKSFVFYAISQVAHSFLAGHLIDRYTARKVYPYAPIPLLLSTVYFCVSNSHASVIIFFVGAGASIGLYSHSKNALWAEIYGLKNLASLKGVDSTSVVVATAIAPILFPYIQEQFSFSFMMNFCIAIMVFAWLFYMMTATMIGSFSKVD